MKLRRYTGTATPGWAQPGNHGAGRVPVVVYIRDCEISIVQHNGRRIFVELEGIEEYGTEEGGTGE